MGISGSDQQEAAETMALRALTWLAGNEDLFPVFLGATGASASDIAGNAAKPEFLASVLDFLLSDDVWVAAFCDTINARYDEPMRARAVLPGGEQINWT